MTKTEQDNLAICVFQTSEHERRLDAIETKMNAFLKEMREKLTILLETQRKQCQTTTPLSPSVK
jgi:hypothetical protein